LGVTAFLEVSVVFEDSDGFFTAVFVTAFPAFLAFTPFFAFEVLPAFLAGFSAE
jgi:hypothetical protein